MLASQHQRRMTRKPEDVKFRTFDEEKATLQLGRASRKASVEERVGVDSFEFLGLIGQGSYGKVFMAKKKKSNKFYAIKMI
jgi:serine/threonine protein kinase